MTKAITINYTALLCTAVLLAGFTTAYASEVTGTLSSDTAATVPTGSITGTVESSGGGSSSGGSRSSSGGSSLANAPSGATAGAVLGSTQTPGFPNAGVAPEEDSADQSLWSALMTFLRNTFSF